MSFVNKYTKMAAYDTWNYIRKRGRYQLYECDDLNVIQTDILKKKDFWDIWTKYNRWHISYDVNLHPFNAYLCTQVGFFAINFYSWTIMKGLPSAKPYLCASDKTYYENLNKEMNSLATTKDNEMLEKMQLFCLLNLLLKDLIAIVNYIGDNAKNKIPKLLNQIVGGLYSFNNSEDKRDFHDIKNIIKGTEDECDQAKVFLNTYSDKMNDSISGKLFYRKEASSTQDKATIVGKIGMVFNYNINNIFILTISDIPRDTKLLNESVLMTGRWCEMFKLQYHFK